MLIPIGPVAVFGASNFPLAFSVPAATSASALAAGCPVVVKAHPAHPATSELCLGALLRGAEAAGAPTGTVAAVQGVRAGRPGRSPVYSGGRLHRLLGGRRALFDLASSRPDPIPFYGELSSLNPVVVTPAAASERGAAIGKGFVESFTLGVGQFCTKPGLHLRPQGSRGSVAPFCYRIRCRLAIRRVMLSGAFGTPFSPALSPGEPGRCFVPEGTCAAERGGFAVSPAFYKVAAAALADEPNRSLIEECFGPSRSSSSTTMPIS